MNIKRKLFRTVAPFLLVPLSFVRPAPAQPPARAKTPVVTMSAEQKLATVKNLKQLEQNTYGLFMTLNLILEDSSGMFSHSRIGTRDSLDEIFQQAGQIMLNGDKNSEFSPVPFGKNVLVIIEGDDKQNVELTCKRVEKTKGIFCKTFGR